MERYFDVVQTRYGRAIGGAQVAVYIDGTNDLATLYSDNGVTTTPNPTTTNIDGEYAFYAANGSYRIQITAAGYDGEIKPGVVIYDPREEGMIKVRYFVVPGSSDDTEQVRAAHAAANLLGVPVSYAGLEEVSIQANAQIAVHTSTYWDGCRLIILGGYNPTPSYNTFNKMFLVTDPDCPLVDTGFIAATDPLEQGSRTPSLGVFENHGYVLLEAGFQVPDRAKTGTINYTQSFKVNRYGVVSHPLSVDLSAFAGSVRFQYRLTSVRRLVISGLSLYEGVWNNQHVYDIQRCNVLVENTTLIPTPDFSGVYRNTCEIIRFENCSDIEVNGYVTTGRPNDPGYSGYILAIYGGADILTNNVNGVTGWGATGTNRVNGWKVNNCVINRIDVHDSAHNIFVENCDLQDIGLVYGWGGGVISVKNCRAINTSVVSIRSDYGGTFFGNIIIDGVDVTHDGTNRYYVFDGQRYKPGASTPVYLPREIEIRNIRRYGNTLSAVAELTPFDIEVNPATAGVVYAPRQIIVSDFQSRAGNVFGWRLDVNNMEGAPDNFNVTWIYVDDLHFNSAVSGVTSGCLDYPNVRAVTNPVQIRAHFNNCWNLGVVSTLDSNNQQWLVNGGSLNVLSVRQTSPYCAVRVDGVRMTAAAADIANPVIGSGISGVTNNTVVQNCLIGADFNFSSVAALQGNNTWTTSNPTWPGGVTATLAFTGWRAAGAFKV